MNTPTPTTSNTSAPDPVPEQIRAAAQRFAGHLAASAGTATGADSTAPAPAFARPLTGTDNGSALYQLGGPASGFTDHDLLTTVISTAASTLMIDGYAHTMPAANDGTPTGPDSLLQLLFCLALPGQIGIRVTIPADELQATTTAGIVAVPLSEEVRIRGLISARAIPATRIGVVDTASNALEIQDLITLPYPIPSSPGI